MKGREQAAMGCILLCYCEGDEI